MKKDEMKKEEQIETITRKFYLVRNRHDGDLYAVPMWRIHEYPPSEFVELWFGQHTFPLGWSESTEYKEALRRGTELARKAGFDEPAYLVGLLDL